MTNKRKLPAISSEVHKISSEVSGCVNRDHSFLTTAFSHYVRQLPKILFVASVNLSPSFFRDPFESILMNERKLPAISSEVTKISSEVSGGVNRGDHSHPQNTHSIHRITLLVHYLQH